MVFLWGCCWHPEQQTSRSRPSAGRCSCPAAAPAPSPASTPERPAESGRPAAWPWTHLRSRLSRSAPPSSADRTALWRAATVSSLRLFSTWPTCAVSQHWSFRLLQGWGRSYPRPAKRLINPEVVGVSFRQQQLFFRCGIFQSKSIPWGEGIFFKKDFTFSCFLWKKGFIWFQKHVSLEFFSPPKHFFHAKMIFSLVLMTWEVLLFHLWKRYFHKTPFSSFQKIT